MDRVEQLKATLEAAADNGWNATTSFVVVRVSTHRTPDNIPEDWWPDQAYVCVEVLDFVFHSRDRVPTVVYKIHSRPWVEGTERRISYRVALELLAQPFNESTVHDH